MSESLITEEWKEIDVANGGDVVKAIDPDKVINVLDPEDIVDPAAKIVLVKTEEVWLTDGTSDQPYTMIQSSGYIRKATEAEDAMLRGTLLSDGIILASLRSLF